MAASKNTVRQRIHRAAHKDEGARYLTVRLSEETAMALEATLDALKESREKWTQQEVVEEAISAGLEGPCTWIEAFRSQLQGELALSLRLNADVEYTIARCMDRAQERTIAELAPRKYSGSSEMRLWSLKKKSQKPHVAARKSGKAARNSNRSSEN